MGRRQSAKLSETDCSACEETGTFTRRPLFQGLGVRVDDFHCRAHAKSKSAEEPNPTHSIVFVRRGLFTRTDRDGTIVGDANQILFFNRDQGYRYEHPLPDVRTSAAGFTPLDRRGATPRRATIAVRR